MYVAKVDDMELTFEASGKLWQDGLVMEDDQTGSLWSQITGECIKGKLLGKKLELISSTYSTFEKSKELGSISYLKKPEKGGNASHYQKYFEDNSKIGIFGRKFSGTLLNAKDKVIGIRSDSEQIAIPISLVRPVRPVFLSFAGKSLLIVADGIENFSCFVLPEGQFEQPNIKTKRDSMIITDAVGAGQLEFKGIIPVNGTELETFPAISSFWFAWKSFFPATAIYSR